MCKGRNVGAMGLVGNGWSVDWSEEIEMQRSGPAATTSRFFRGRGQLDDLIFGGLADDVFHGKGLENGD